MKTSYKLSIHHDNDVFPFNFTIGDFVPVKDSTVAQNETEDFSEFLKAVDKIKERQVTGVIATKIYPDKWGELDLDSLRFDYEDHESFMKQLRACADHFWYCEIPE